MHNTIDAVNRPTGKFRMPIYKCNMVGLNGCAFGKHDLRARDN